MKNIQYIIIGLYLALAGCEKVLDKEPLDIISDAVVWQDEDLVESYLNDLYYRADFVNLTGQAGFNQGMIASMGAECRPFGAWQDPYPAATGIINETGAHNNLEYWKYDNIRDVNYFIEKMVSEAAFPQAYTDQRIAEARFLRAYMYFEMVKRYGGVPIITETQSIDTPVEELYVPRNSEKEVYDFIGSEMDALVQILPVSYDSDGLGRPTRWAAYALKSRAMLYAASIAKYGQQQLNGLLGFPASDEQDYAQQSYDASMAIIASDHALYTEHADPVHNFGQIFIDESEANKEVIFSERFDYSQLLSHSLNNLAMPDGFARGWGSNFNYFYDFVELYEFADGSPGTSVSRSDLTSQEWDMDSLFGNRDPRFIASIFYPGVEWQGGNVLFHTSTIVGGVKETSGTIGTEGWPASAPRRNTLRTGFHLRKRINEDIIQPLGGTDDTDYIVFRMGEIYLNLAEAAYYLGLTGEALTAINDLRARAGMPPKGAIDEDVIRNERYVELTFEDHRYWDLRRWRIAVQVIDGVRLKGLQYDFNWDTQLYQITLKNGEGVVRTFQDRHYYLPLGVDRLADNPSFIENVGY